MPVTAETYERVALEDPEGRWELHRGRLREKPGMTFAHNQTIMLVGAQLLAQVDLDRFMVRLDSGRLRRTDETYYIPDLFVAPLGLPSQDWERSDVLETYGEPMLLVVEVWSPSTGAYDVDGKLPEYRRRGDREIWRIHPYDRTLMRWQRQTDGSYAESVHHSGSIQPVAVPGVAIDLDALFHHRPG
jgi:Uma2 family endonuclease